MLIDTSIYVCGWACVWVCVGGVVVEHIIMMRVTQDNAYIYCGINLLDVWQTCLG